MRLCITSCSQVGLKIISDNNNDIGEQLCFDTFEIDNDGSTTDNFIQSSSKILFALCQIQRSIGRPVDRCIAMNQLVYVAVICFFPEANLMSCREMMVVVHELALSYSYSQVVSGVVFIQRPRSSSHLLHLLYPFVSVVVVGVAETREKFYFILVVNVIRI